MKKQSGNILIYILGAIFLIGLLTVISRGSVTPGASIDPEQLMIRVSEVQEYGRELEQAVAYIMANGHSESDIRFAHPDADSAYGLITDIPSRQVFAREGGGAKYRAAPASIQAVPTDWLFSGENQIQQVGSSASSATSVDLLALLPNVTKDFCLKINSLNDITNPFDVPPQAQNDVNISTPFAGTFNNTELINDVGGYLSQRLEGCFEGGGTPSTGTYHYFRVLLAR